MIKIKNKYKLLAVIIIIPVIAGLFILNSIIGGNAEENNENRQIPLTSAALKQMIPAQIDSILYTFGIEKEWIKNIDPGADTTKKSKDKPDPRYEKAWLIKK